MNKYSLQIGDSKVRLLSIVKGLVSEGDEVKSGMKDLDIDFELGALPISEQELKGLNKLVAEESFDDEELDIQPSNPEKIYAEKLSRFGEVSLPPPAYIAFLNFCSEHEIDVEAFDMDEEHYTMAYCDHVSGTQWLRQALREKRLHKKKIEAETPEDFAVEWDAVINKLKGYQDLEEHREKVMAKNIKRLSKRGALIALIEEERVQGVVDLLKNEDK